MHKIRDMRTWSILGDYDTEAQATEMVRQMVESPEAPHWLQVIKVDGGHEVLVESDIGLTWKVFGAEAARPLIAESIHYFLNRERQMLESMPSVGSDAIFRDWHDHYRSAHKLVRWFVDADGLVPNEDFFNQWRKLSAQTYQLTDRASHNTVRDKPMTVDKYDLDLLDGMVGRWRTKNQ
jgi:hypothetical protein